MKEMFQVMPARPDKCQECAGSHPLGGPHNPSLFYKMKFYTLHARLPSWSDAMTHCDDETKNLWTTELVKMGIDVNAPIGGEG